MKILRRTLAVAGIATLAGIGLTGVAGAVDYTPPPEVQGITQDPAVEAVAVSAGTLPYTGNDSSLPLAEVGVGLLAAGGLTVVMVRRHQANQA
jgi:LPXTG-motif cell wall-anchored protein